ncbi:DUF2796 domain-containing protein [Silanimonas sp.]|jgi:hypothetical protein|uniref:ZrgA family zinc uptake protein n=1 Tax=Silanimonas sp. TaxID=1929290 RepID=UPI0022C98EB9|nr:DUF2796 domain-containing protein [Silanimonas sp.]MCZ8115829.1 DUF2796 domain-containing protein [Silanimonas sp.]
MRLGPSRAALIAALALPSVAAAQAQHAHVHGQAFVDVAVDGGLVEINLRATAQDLVGFERAAATPEEEAQVLAARKAVLDHARLWQFNAAARCVAEGPVLEVPGAGKAHDHDHSHDHEGHDDHVAHSDWTVRYRFRCSAPEALSAIESGMFAVFPSLQSATVQVLDANGAREETLTASANRLALAQ